MLLLFTYIEMEQTRLSGSPPGSAESNGPALRQAGEAVPFTADQMCALSAEWDAMEARLREDSRRVELADDAQSRVRRICQRHCEHVGMKIIQAIVKRVVQNRQEDRGGKGTEIGDDMAPFEKHIAAVATAIASNGVAGAAVADKSDWLTTYDAQWAAVRKELAETPDACVVT